MCFFLWGSAVSGVEAHVGILLFELFLKENLQKFTLQRWAGVDFLPALSCFLVTQLFDLKVIYLDDK